jgi:hypothetical protein
MDRRHAAVLGGKVILKAGRDAYHLALDICGDRDESIRRKPFAD